MNTPVDETKTQLDELLSNLLAAIESADSAKTLHAQQVLTGTITTLWSASDDLAPKDKAISRLVVGWAVHELPTQIHDPANYAEIKHQVKILQRSLILFS